MGENVPSYCRACGREGKLTKEDIQPNWQRRLILDWIEQTRDVVTDQLPARHTIRICETCNSAMGRSLEMPASHVLPAYFLGQAAKIRREHHGLMAAWASKTMLLASMNSWRPGHWGFRECQTALASIVRDARPPEGLHVRVGLLDRASQKRGLTGILPPAMPRYEFYSLSVDLELVWEVFLSPHPSLTTFRHWADRNDRWLARIWPSPERDVHWPPNQISRVQLEQHRGTLLANRNVKDPLPQPVRRTFTVPPATDPRVD